MAFLLDFSIIGGGLTATAMLWQCVRQSQTAAENGRLSPSRIRIRIFEKQAEFGPGFPHNQHVVLPFHITNMCASDMGIFPENPGDFNAWVIRHTNGLRTQFDWFGHFLDQQADAPGICHHYPRAIMGEYLKTRFAQAVEAARQMGICLTLYPCTEVIELTRHREKMHLSVRDLPAGTQTVVVTDQVLLATGHWARKRRDPRYLESPWPAEALRRNIPMGCRVAIIGTSLSAIETLLTLTSEDRFFRSANGTLVYKPPENTRTFMLYSRSGLLPKVRGRTGAYRNRLFRPDTIRKLWEDAPGSLDLKTVFRLLDSELRTAYGRSVTWDDIRNPSAPAAAVLAQSLKDALEGDNEDGDVRWQTVLLQGLGAVGETYLNLSLGQRKKFDDGFTSAFFTHAATQPAINAEKLLALIKSGIADVRRLGHDYRLRKNGPGTQYIFEYRDARGLKQQDTHDYVVNARGQDKSVETDRSSLTRRLIASGQLLLTEKRASGSTTARRMADAPDSYKTGSIWIDPATHRVMQTGAGGQVMPSESMYAVGAMTRGQIIDASMARSIVRSVSKVASHLFEQAVRRYRR